MRLTKSPDARTRPSASFDFSGSDPLVISRHQYQVAYFKVFLGKSTAKKSRPPTSPTNQKKQRGAFVRSGQISYRNLAGVDFKDRINKTDDLKLSYSALELAEHDLLLAQLVVDSEVEVVLGVKGMWHIKRRMIVRTIEPDYGTEIKLTFTLNDTGMKAADAEETKTFSNQKLSAIFTGLARLAGMRAQVDLNEDPVISHLSMGRRTVAKTVVDLAAAYGCATKFTNNVLYVQEYLLDDQPNAKFIFGGPLGNILHLKVKGSVSGIKGKSTVAKRRSGGKGKKKKEEQKAAKPNQTLAIAYLDKGGYAKQIVTNQNKSKASQPQARAKEKNRTVSTPRTGKDAARLAKGAHTKRTLKVVSGSMSTINTPITPNSIMLVGGSISKVFAGKYYAGDVSYKWDKGVWKVSVSLRTTRLKSSGKKKKAKSKRGKKKTGPGTKTKAAKPKVVITYKKNGTYQAKRVGFKKTKTGGGS